MDLSAVIAEVEGAAQQEAAGIAILETTHFEPELGLTAERCLVAAKRRAEGLAEAVRLLRKQSDMDALLVADMRRQLGRGAA